MPPRPNADRDLVGFGSWDVSPVPLPARSRLYHLAPIGLGSSEVESLTGYVVRLAAAHSVSPFVLARREIAPVLGTERFAGVETQLGALMGRGARRLNGVEPGAERWVEALAALTKREDLHGLTLRPWAGVIASQDLLRTTLAWCPTCYEQWRSSGREVYQPLLWALNAVMVCPHHRRPLQSRCPDPACGRLQPAIGPAMRPGHCTTCGHWLGKSEEKPSEELSNGSPAIPKCATPWRLWVAEAVGEMLEASPLLTGPFPPDRVREVIGECVDRFGGDDLLRNVAHPCWYTVELWRRGSCVPSLGLLLRFCYHLGTTPHRLLVSGAAAVDLRGGCWPFTPEAPKSRCRRGSFGVEAARQAMTRILTDSSERLPSVSELAQQLGCDVRGLRGHLPEECRRLIERRLAQRQREINEAGARRSEEVRRATIAVHEQGLYPNGHRVAALLSNPDDLIRSELREVWKATIRELGWQPRKRKGGFIA